MSDGAAGLNLRQAVRGLMIDPSDRILLAHMRFSDGAFWVLPGGGIEPGESHRDALTRELREETGVPELFIGPPLWRRGSLHPGMGNGRWDGQLNTVYLIPCPAFDPAPQMTAEELAAEYMFGIRWWSLDEIAASEEDFRPDGLVGLTAKVLDHGAPPAPWDLGIAPPRDLRS